jgi:hypothetical protein
LSVEEREGFECSGGRYFAGSMTSHPVGDGEHGVSDKE